jgi:hypothetical protein
MWKERDIKLIVEYAGAAKNREGKNHFFLVFFLSDKKCKQYSRKQCPRLRSYQTSLNVCSLFMRQLGDLTLYHRRCKGVSRLEWDFKFYFILFEIKRSQLGNKLGKNCSNFN